MALSDPERARLDAVYDAYEADTLRWDPGNPGNRQILAERRGAVRRLLREHSVRLSDAFAVDLGCGAGTTLAELLAAGASPASLAGVDVLGWRLEQARGRFPGVGMVRADGRHLPFRSNSVDVVAAFTLFSSVLDGEVATDIGREATRVLAPGGLVLIYDVAVPNPRNRNIRPVRGAAIRALFPGFDVTSRSLTVLPPLARGLPHALAGGYRLLAAVPALRTHRLWLLRPSD